MHAFGNARSRAALPYFPEALFAYRALAGGIALAALLAAGCGAEPADPPPGTPPGTPPAGDTRAAGAKSGVEQPVVLFLGTSLTAGYGLPSDEAFAALIEERIESARLDYRVVNAGVSGDTSAGGLARLDWLLRLPIAVLVLELGANDMLRGLDVSAMERNLQQIIDRTRAAHHDVKVVVAGIRAAPNLGSAYAGRFDAVFSDLARRNDATLIPFLLEGVAAVRRLNQADGIHPTAEGHRHIAKTIWPTLEPILHARAGS